MAQSRLGAHLPGGRDLQPAAEIADRLSFETFQVFLHGPTMGKMPQCTEEDDREFRSMAEERGQISELEVGSAMFSELAGSKRKQHSTVRFLRAGMRNATAEPKS